MLAIMLFFGWFAAFPAILYGTLPALVIGGALQAAARSDPWAATRPPWAGAGATGGALVYACLTLHWEPPTFLPEPVMASVVAAAGACGGLLFRELAGVGCCDG